MRYFIDCEFDGHNGPLLSIAVVAEDSRSIYIKTTNTAKNSWVIQHVVPVLDTHLCAETYVSHPDSVGALLLGFIRDSNPVIVADSPVDIARFCTAISTAPDGGWHSTNFSDMTLCVLNVATYPTDVENATQHNAWWDAFVLYDYVKSKMSDFA